MGQRGPTKTPTHTLTLRGSPSAKGRSDAVSVPPGVPDAPAHLTAGAKAEWGRVVPVLVAAGLLTHLDRTVLAGYCQAYGRWATAEKTLAEMGDVIDSPSGYPVQNPHLAIANRAMADAVKLAIQLGLTPAARSRLDTMPPEKPEAAGKGRFFKTG